MAVTITSLGYDASVGEIEWAPYMSSLGADAGIVGTDDLAVTLAGGLDVTVRAGRAHGWGVVDSLPADDTLTLTRPSVGSRYDCVVLRRDWAANRTALAVVPGGSTRAVPALTQSPGVATDQALALVMVPADPADAPVISDDLRVTHTPTGVVRTARAMTGPVGSRYVYEQDGQRWWVSPAGPALEWEPPAPTLPAVPVIATGTAACDFNTGYGEGVARITHGLPWVPSVVVCKARTTETSGMVQVTLTVQPGAINATWFAVNAKIRTAGGWAPYTGNLTYIDWWAHKEGTPATLPSETPIEPPADDGLPDVLPPVVDAPVTTPDTDVAPAPQIPIPQTPPAYAVTAPTQSSVAGILATAAGEIGVREYPSGSNKVKYWLAEKPSWNGSAWCACFAAWVYRRNGISVNTVLEPTDNNPYYTPYLEAAAKKKGLWYTGTPRPGDMVIYGGSANTHAVHVEIVEKWLPDVGRVQTIGGNTSDGLNGSPNNGGGVYRNKRNPKSASLPIRGYIRMPTAVPTALQVKGPFPLPSGHYFGVADAASTLDHNGVADNAQGVSQIQAEVGAAVDGVYGPATEALVRKWQTAMFRTVTGRVYAADWDVFLGRFTAPPRPTGIVATAGVKAATVVFNASSGAQQYTANIVGTATVKTATSSPITFTSLTPGLPVQITVTATNVGGASDVSARSNTVYPTEGSLSTVFLSDGSVIPTWEGTSGVPQLVASTTVANRDATTYQQVTTRFPAAMFTSAVQQAARNAAVVLYDGGSTFPWPAARPKVEFEFVSDAGMGIAWADSAASRITFGRSAGSTPNVAAWFTHEVVHLVQRDSPIYSSNVYAAGVIEGIADYVLIRLGYHTRDGSRPSGGGTNWWDGYDTTGFFLHWIEWEAPTRSPDFVRRLNQQMSSASWTPTQITGINARSRTVEALWTEYKAWIAAGN